MSNYSSFFPISSGTGGSSGSSSSTGKTNRKIFYGPSSCTWPVPSGTTEVEVHVWGGGGGCNSGCCWQGGGGGGGYARATYTVTGTDSLSITVGGAAGTSSVTIPTQSPTSPISATGGNDAPATTCCNSNCQCKAGGTGGSGSVSLSPQHPTHYCFTASGGQGGMGFVACLFDPPTSDYVMRGGTGGGGAAGSPKGTGGNGSSSDLSCVNSQVNHAGAGGGIGGNDGCFTNGGGAYGFAHQCYGGDRNTAGSGKNGNQSYLNASVDIFAPTVTTCNTHYLNANLSSCVQDYWFAVEEIGGSGGLGFNNGGCDFINGYNNTQCPSIELHRSEVGGTGAGGGGGGDIGATSVNPSGAHTCLGLQVFGARGGLLGGGGGNPLHYRDLAPAEQNTAYQWGTQDGKGGNAGGSSGSPGTPGIVIVYW